MNPEIIPIPTANHRRAWLLGTASALVLGATVPMPAWASYNSTETYYDAGAFAVGYTTILADPQNNPPGFVGTLALSATITNGITGVVLPTGTSGSAAVTANSQIATVGGNDVINTISGTLLPLPNAANPTPDGIAVLTVATNIQVAATSVVTGGVLAAELTAASASAALVSANTVSAGT